MMIIISSFASCVQLCHHNSESS